MKHPDLFHHCILCSDIIDFRVYTHTVNLCGLPVCKLCENEFRLRSKSASPRARKLYVELIRQGVKANLEDNDGYKTVDIVIHKARLHIEVDGLQHHRISQYAISDLKRTFYALSEGYVTVRIPNCLVDDSLDETVLQLKKLIELRHPGKGMQPGINYCTG